MSDLDGEVDGVTVRWETVPLGAAGTICVIVHAQRFMHGFEAVWEHAAGMGRGIFSELVICVF